MWPPKGTNGCEITSFEPLSVKIAPKLWPVAATKKRTDRYVNKKIPHKTCIFHACVVPEKEPLNGCVCVCAQIRNGLIGSNQILHINSLGGHSNIFDMTSKLVEGFRRGGGAKMGLSYWLRNWHWLLTQRIALPRIRVNHASISYRFRDIASYLSKVADFNPPRLHLAPP